MFRGWMCRVGGMWVSGNGRDLLQGGRGHSTARLAEVACGLGRICQPQEAAPCLTATGTPWCVGRAVTRGPRWAAEAALLLG